ncbi:MAG TPA: 2-octaprenyl-6-methoxyphenyl hydroxylase [Steroidobacteraceae bacterium]|nr:2-octaprenyl-6-methoxyphenyl hydroxylase [Steroidobacteraceae bacterium]
MSESVQADVAIIGGGMVGASLALALADSGLATVLVEGIPPGSQGQPSFDDRTTALGNASRRIFEALRVWPDMRSAAAAITTIHVSDAGRFGFARLHAREQGIDAFGYVVPNRVIGAALWRRLQQCQHVRVCAPARPEQVRIESDRVVITLAPGRGSGSPPVHIEARLAVGADGAHSMLRASAGIDARIEDYEQVAVIANVRADRAHDGTAYERFTPTGPVAVLPLKDGSYGVIWTARPERAAEILALDDRSFLRELQERFGWRAGAFIRAGVRASYPLKLTRAATTLSERSVLIGNAAQSLHPIAGQGFNLGLRDAAMLAERLVGSPGDPGSRETLEQFGRWREGDRSGVTRFTDGLVKLFGDTRPGVGAARNIGLLLFDLLPPAKSALARVSAGFAGPIPRLARGLTIRP